MTELNPSTWHIYLIKHIDDVPQRGCHQIDSLVEDLLYPPNKQKVEFDSNLLIMIASLSQSKNQRFVCIKT